MGRRFYRIWSLYRPLNVSATIHMNTPLRYQPSPSPPLYLPQHSMRHHLVSLRPLL
ncbi:hypothetical protein PM082_018385 [Marasmius tenuissimus]|nr:hypothetical protein PM082_018385 [Marasmius tenuissimus]